MTGSQKPYISFVATSRNDNHGGDMRKRMRIFVRGLIHQCNAFQLPAELIMVEWNPPNEEPLLHEVLPQPEADDYLRIRYIVVPEAMHHTLNFSDKLPLFQMIAKNVGIRRAYAPFVCCTNIDLLFADALFETLAARQLQPGHYYRANRCDIPESIDEQWEVPEMLRFSEANILKRLGKSRFYPNFTDTTSILFRFWGMIPVFRALSGFKRLITPPVQTKLQEMDTEACGDFTLMSKEDWLNIQGYPELEVYSLHIDSMGLLAANACNIKQVIFPYQACTYHIRHVNGWEFDSPRERVLFFTNKPVLDWWSVYSWGKDILEKGERFNFNRPDWGLANEELEEIIV
ncbi:MAG: hypothetical protein AAGB22_00630 [Bacteroidota bacterium]